MTPLRVLLVGNYVPDQQPSMQRFAGLLQEGLAARGVNVTLLKPAVRMAGRGIGAGLEKWLGYVDKLVLFPPRLGRACQPGHDQAVIIHICDHSNAVYVPWIRHVPRVVTCHDLLAVRAARCGFPGTRTRWSGRILQRAIVRGLRAADYIACDSQATRADLSRLLGTGRASTVIQPGLSPQFTPIAADRAYERVVELIGRPARRYILHVGGNQWYKNRLGAAEIYAALVGRMPDAPLLVMAGEAPSRELSDLIAARGLTGRVIDLSDVTDPDLAALYSRAELLLFPSLAEGFGWPVAEAMACGCRVVASNRAPLTEVGGKAASYFDPTKLEAAADTIARVLTEPDAERRARVAAGLERARTFGSDTMVERYLQCYGDIHRRHSVAAN